MDGSEESLLDATYLSLPSPFTQACCRPHSSHRPVWRALLSRALGTVRSTDSMIDSCERTASARQRLSLTLFLASHVAQGFVDRALEGLIAPILIHRTQPNAEAGGGTGFPDHDFGIQDVAFHQRLELLEHLGVDGGRIAVFHSLQERTVTYHLLAGRPVILRLAQANRHCREKLLDLCRRIGKHFDLTESHDYREHVFEWVHDITANDILWKRLGDIAEQVANRTDRNIDSILSLLKAKYDNFTAAERLGFARYPSFRLNIEAQLIHELNQLPPSPPHNSSDDDDDLNQDFLPPNHNLENRNPN